MDSRHYDIDMRLLRLREQRRRRKVWRNRVLFLGVVWLLVFQLFGIGRVQGDSMNPAYHGGDLVFYVRILPRELTYGDVVLLKNPAGGFSIKRIAGLPGDELTFDEEGHLTRNGQPVIEREIIYKGAGLEAGTAEAVPASVTVAEGEYFYLGDNRPVSLDSRAEEVGCAGREDIRGLVIAAYKLQ